jgi:hypothetical protein
MPWVDGSRLTATISADGHTKQANGALFSYSRDRQANDANGQRQRWTAELLGTIV